MQGQSFIGEAAAGMEGTYQKCRDVDRQLSRSACRSRCGPCSKRCCGEIWRAVGRRVRPGHAARVNLVWLPWPLVCAARFANRSAGAPLHRDGGRVSNDFRAKAGLCQTLTLTLGFRQSICVCVCTQYVTHLLETGHSYLSLLE